MDSWEHSKRLVRTAATLDLLDLADENVECPGPTRLNYFNFYTEVEEEFVRRRGTHLLISPIDWALVETWKNAGVPLHVVLRGINKAFDSRDARPRRTRKVNSVLYCQQAVEETFADWSLSQIGASSAGSVESLTNASGKKYPAGLTAEEAIQFVGRLDAELSLLDTKSTGAHLADELTHTENPSEGSVRVSALTNPLFLESVGRARTRLLEIRASIKAAGHADAEALELDLDSIDQLLLEKARASCESDQLGALAKEAKDELRGYKTKMKRELYDQTIQNFIARRLREIHGIPRLSLFYI